MNEPECQKELLSVSPCPAGKRIRLPSELSNLEPGSSEPSPKTARNKEVPLPPHACAHCDAAGLDTVVKLVASSCPLVMARHVPGGHYDDGDDGDDGDDCDDCDCFFAPRLDRSPLLSL